MAAQYDRRDSFHQRAKREGLRSRAAYKLQEFQRAHRLLRPNQRVVDLGCWPGGWLQVASKAVGPGGRVIGVDLVEIDPPLDHANTVAIVADLREAGLGERIRRQLGGRADLLLSDAAPKLSGVRDADRANEERLLEAVEELIPELLREGGDLLLKILESPDAQVIDRRIRQRFQRAKSLKAAATRRGSSERYLLARGWKGS
jgi:23S rRNA (uridine2552-2'-O)-methyltransferase